MQYLISIEVVLLMIRQSKNITSKELVDIVFSVSVKDMICWSPAHSVIVRDNYGISPILK